MSFTWLVLFVVIGLTGAWWWQNHKAQQEEITTMADQSSAELNANNVSSGQDVPLDTGAAQSQTPDATDTAQNAPTVDNSLLILPRSHQQMRLLRQRRRTTPWLLLPRPMWITPQQHQRPQRLLRCQPIRRV